MRYMGKEIGARRATRLKNRVRGGVALLGLLALILGLLAWTTPISRASSSPASRLPGPGTVLGDWNCPRGFQAREVRAYGQRLESDPTHLRALVQNSWEDQDDHRYVVVAACVRDLNAAEHEQLYYWGAR